MLIIQNGLHMFIVGFPKPIAQSPNFETKVKEFGNISERGMEFDEDQNPTATFTIVLHRDTVPRTFKKEMVDWNRIYANSLRV